MTTPAAPPPHAGDAPARDAPARDALPRGAAPPGAPAPPPGAPGAVFPGTSEMAARCRAVDWAATPLGPAERWPVSLRTTVATLLTARHPMLLFWGPEYVQLYNDAYIPTLGGPDRHPGALGRPAADWWAGDVWAFVGPALDAVVATGEATGADDQAVPLPRHGRVEETYWTYRYSPAYDDAGRVSGVLLITQETTARVRAEAERERLLAGERAARAEAEAARGAAEAASRAKSEFLAVMSHELRTPLNAIGGYAELIEMGLHGPVTPEQRQALERIQRSQRALLSLINEVLNYTRLETGAVTYELVDVRVAEAVAEAEVLVAPQLRAKGLGYASAACDPALAVRADRDKLQQVLRNLLSNAVKFTNAGPGLAGRVEVTCAVACAPDRAAAGRVAIRIRDTGIGIPADKLAAVFDPFVQVDTALTRTQQGTGLGLAISRDLARGMGGDLTVESTPGVGSTFALTLPHA